MGFVRMLQGYRVSSNEVKRLVDPKRAGTVGLESESWVYSIEER